MVVLVDGTTPKAPIQERSFLALERTPAPVETGCMEGGDTSCGGGNHRRGFRVTKRISYVSSYQDRAIFRGEGEST